LTIEPVTTFNHMVEHAVLDGVFHALADPTRRAMVRRLSDGECTVSELAAPFSISLAASSKHVQVLERAGLVRRTVEGRRHVCRLDPEPLAAATGWLDYYQSFWAPRLDRLESLVSAQRRTGRSAEET
jgi:DNA-binding transcriptional ArsR family regulator